MKIDVAAVLIGVAAVLVTVAEQLFGEKLFIRFTVHVFRACF